jgi:hypothetical protein
MEVPPSADVAPSTKVMIAWFCPWAQRAWLVANMCNENYLSTTSIGDTVLTNYEIICDDTSIVLETDNEGRGSRFHDITADSDGISKLMLKGPDLGSHSVPAIFTTGAVAFSGNSIEISKWIWLHGCQHPLYDFIASDAAEDEANKWSRLITEPFYDSFMNRENAAQMKFEELIRNIAAFGNAIIGTFYYGDTPSLVDVAIFPFLYRIFTLRLFQTFRKAEISEFSLALLEVDQTRDTHDPQGEDIARALTSVGQWIDNCLHTSWCKGSLPGDAESANGFYSSKLNALYTIYALGVGLKSVPCVSL